MVTSSDPPTTVFEHHFRSIIPERPPSSYLGLTRHLALSPGRFHPNICVSGKSYNHRADPAGALPRHPSPQPLPAPHIRNRRREKTNAGPDAAQLLRLEFTRTRLRGIVPADRSGRTELDEEAPRHGL